MPKRVNNIFYDNLKYKYMYSAYTRASKNKHFNKDVILYELDLSNNITNALKRLYSNFRFHTWKSAFQRYPHPAGFYPF